MIQQNLVEWYGSQGIGVAPPTQRFFNGRRRSDYIRDVNEGRVAPYPIFVAYDKFKHCYLSCMMTRAFGPDYAWAVGYAHEYVNQGYDEKDLVANDYGIEAAQASMGGKIVLTPPDCKDDGPTKDCVTKCQQKYPFVFLWPRYPG